MKTLYTIGYTGLDPVRFYRAVRTLGAVLLDIRMSPYSRNPAWNGQTLREALGAFDPEAPYDAAGLYLWAGDTLGNLAYKEPGQIDLADPALGFERLGSLLKHRPVLLLCVCPKLAGCHRAVVADMARLRFGCHVHHLMMAMDGRLVNVDIEAARPVQETLI